MRVIAGAARGRALKAPKGMNTRPMMDIVKGSLFNMLEALDGIHGCVLDLFAGSGSLGIEALSRGADHADFVEQNREAGAIIRENLQRLNFSSQGRIISANVKTFLATRPPNSEGYDLVFVDAPYADQVSQAVLEWLTHDHWLMADALVCVGHHKQETMPERMADLQQIKQRCFGASCIIIYQNHKSPP